MKVPNHKKRNNLRKIQVKFILKNILQFFKFIYLLIIFNQFSSLIVFLVFL